MKNSTVLALALCGAIAFALTGCKYDEAEVGGAGVDSSVVDSNVDSKVDDLASGADLKTAGNDDEAARLAAEEAARRAAAEAAARAAKDADETSLDSATQVPFDQDPNYARCTDVNFAPVYFGFDNDTISAGELPKIETVARHLQANANRVVIIEGNCDERGSNEYNLTLGEQRANNIRDYLVRVGIDERRIQTKSYGEEHPAVQGSNEAAWAKNRRGEFAVYMHQ